MPPNEGAYRFQSPDPSRKISLLSRSSDYLSSLSSYLAMKLSELRSSSWNAITLRGFSFHATDKGGVKPFATKHSDSAESELLKSQLFSNFGEDEVLATSKTDKNDLISNSNHSNSNPKQDVLDFVSNNPRFNNSSKNNTQTTRKVQKAVLSSKLLVEKYANDSKISTMSKTATAKKTQVFRSPLPPGLE